MTTTMEEEHCKKHDNEQFRFFCTDCESLICDECIDDGHGKHAFCSVRRAADTKRPDLVEQLGIGKQAHLDRLHQYSEKVQQCKDNFSNKSEELIEKIDAKAVHLVDRIHNVRGRMVSLVLYYQQQCEEPFTDAQRKVDECLSLINQYSDVVDEIEGKSNIAVVLMHTGLTTKLASIPNPDEISPGPQMTFVEQYGDTPSDRNIETLFGNFTLDSLSDSENYPHSTIGKKDAETNTDFETTVLDHKEKENINVEDDVEIADSNAVVPIMDEYQDACVNFELDSQGAVNKILPCFNSRAAYVLIANSIKFVNALPKDSHLSSGKMQKRQTQHMILSNITDASMSNDGHLLYIEDKKQSLKKFLNSETVVTVAEFQADCTLQCIDVSSCDHILVCHTKRQENRKRTCIVELDSDGVQLKSILFSMTYRFPYRFCQNVSGDMPFLDLEGPGISRGCVRVVDSDLKHIATYAGAIGPKPSDTFEPRGICCDAESQIIVTDCRNHAVHLLSPKGKYVRLILTYKDGIRHPVSVNLDRYGLLWVGCLYGKVHVRKYTDLFL